MDIFEQFAIVCDPTKPTFNVTQAAGLLPQLKMQTAFAKDAATLSKGRSALEMALVAAAHTGGDFEKLYDLVRPLEYHPILGNSPQRALCEGLNLMRLLAQNQIAMFHTSMERIDAEAGQSSYVKFPVLLQQFLAEGNYRQLLAARGNPPAPFYCAFLDKITNTVRNDIAACLEAAYEKMSANESGKMLMMNSVDELIMFAEMRGWVVCSDNTIRFTKPEESTLLSMSSSYTSLSLSAVNPKDEKLPTNGLIENAILYAKEIERIV